MKFPFNHTVLKIILLFLLGSTFSCENNIEEVNTLTSKKNLPVDKANNIELIYSDSGRIKMKLTAPLSERFSGEFPYLEFKKGVLVIFFDSLLKEESRISANYAIQKENEQIIEGRNNVEIINQKGEKLNTEQLFWNKKTQSIYTEKFVKITTKDEIIMGNGLEADQHFKKYKIKSVTGMISIKNETDTIQSSNNK